MLRRIYYKIIKTYVESDLRFLSYSDADKLMKQDSDWKLSKHEDDNRVIGMVYICKKTRLIN